MHYFNTDEFRVYRSLDSCGQSKKLHGESAAALKQNAELM